MRGRCLSYGDGITYWPVVEVVKQIPDANTLVEPAAWKALEAMLGDGDGTATPDEIAWAFRKLLEATSHTSASASSTTSSGARRIFPAHRARLRSRAALHVLLLCMARPEAPRSPADLARRQAERGTYGRLEPLSEDETVWS